MNIFHTILISVTLVTVGAGNTVVSVAIAADTPLINERQLLDIGNGYRTGFLTGGKPDWNKASRFYLAATKRGSANGAFFVGRALSNGKLNFQNHKLAAGYYKLSLKRTIGRGGIGRNASYNLGLLYVNGEHGLQRDVQRGIAYIRYAALHGSSSAASFFARAFYEGMGSIKPDHMKSAVWAHIAYASEDEGTRKIASALLRKADAQLKQRAYLKAVSCYQEDVYEPCLE